MPENYVYFAQARDTKLIKIGCSKNPWNRIRHFQCGSADRLSLVLVIPGSRHIEGKLHRQLRQWRKHGEWFKPSEQVWQAINSYRPPRESKPGERVLTSEDLEAAEKAFLASCTKQKRHHEILGGRNSNG